MITENRWALKEWAGVCAGLALGKSCLILRKGGIKEEHDQFHPEHHAFWFYPTQFHQSTDHFGHEHKELSSQKIIHLADSEYIHLQLYAEVVQVFLLNDVQLLLKILSYQLLSEQVVLQRFNYKTPGLCGLILKCYLGEQVVTLPESTRYAGCKSWVELDQSISTNTLNPVLEEAVLRSKIDEISSLLKA